MAATLAHVTKQLERAGFTLWTDGRTHEASKKNRARTMIVSFCVDDDRVSYLSVRNERDRPDSMTDYFPGVWKPNVSQAIKSADASLAYALEELQRHEEQRCGIARGWPCPLCVGGTMEPCGCPHPDHWDPRNGHLPGTRRPVVAVSLDRTRIDLAICLICAEQHAAA